MLLSSLIIGEGPIQKPFTNFHANGKKGGNGKSFILCTEII